MRGYTSYFHHQYPSCGHERTKPCTETIISDNLLLPYHYLRATQPSMCEDCENKWLDNYFEENGQSQTSNSYRAIVDPVYRDHIIKTNAVGNSTPDDRDTSSADHSDNGQLFLGSAVDDSGNGDGHSAGHSDNGQTCSRAVVDESESSCGYPAHSDKSSAIPFNFARTNPSSPEMTGDLDSFVSAIVKTNPDRLDQRGDESDDAEDFVQIESPDTEGDACESFSDNSSFETDSSGSSLCGSSLIRYNILKLRIDELVEQRQQQRQRQASTDHEQDAHADLKDTPLADSINSPESDDHSYDQSTLDIDLVHQRIEATILKRIEENNEREARQEAISKLLDAALLKKDQDERREKNAELGIEEDPHLWDTESLAEIWQEKTSTTVTPDNDSTPVSPHTCSSPKNQQAPTPDSPQKHMYMGSMFADEESAYQRGLREVRPYGNYPGEWEGFLMAFSEDDANRQGLLDPIHVRGCCSEQRADFHLYYGVMHAASEEEAEKRWLEDIRRIPGEEGKFYGLLRADDLRHARAMGLSEIRHPWGCCKDGLFTMPERVLHTYTGFMCATSLKEVEDMGLCDAQPVPGECGDYYGGTYYGYIEAYSELDAFQMGLKDPEHDGECCAKAEAVSISEGHTYYGYMYGRSQEQVMNRGLRDVLLVPGFDIKYSGYLRADSEQAAKAMGLFEPSRIA
ncbi:uncharacterized protein N7500_000298 [Penicillium coprophilum]|uniref:uncharacterized protein n=1 Tax=Penicillium coprophilum TaxID=36646 RepID=UPI002390A249|nr:uncharacterized protein N7500_000298 [Penicillium coprophilum]KAJ5177599.1 hypothetical protein N7500_000298 [Penicillium coprophilum]